MKETATFVFFYGTQEHMSNFHPCTFTSDEHDFCCAEQYIMYRKAVMFGDEATCQAILEATNPAVIKKLGRQVQNYDDEVWADVREQVAYDAVYLKYSQNPHLCAKLLSTEGKHLVEASANDSIWGVGLAQTDHRIHNPAKWRGRNILGEALMQARSTLRAQQ
jgi:ribA/ribD-fused uncharacterized protein